MPTSASLRPLLARALDRLVRHVGGADAGAGDDLPGLVRDYFRAKAERGGAAVGAALGLPDAELAPFEAALRDVERTARRLAEPAPGPTDERNAVLAGVRLVSWLETVAPRVPGPLLDGEVEALVSADVGRKQVRALELVVRSLVTESYGDQERLLARLREALSPKVVAQWQAAADAGDVLSGCSFGELASLFVNREEFARYESLYAETPFLTLLRERRRTLQAFLDDVRRFRNALAHNKRVTNAQLTLLDLYYEEVVGPVQTAFDQGRTKVDPSAHLEVGREDLDRFAAGLKEDVAVVRDDLAALRADLAARLGVIADDTRAVREATRGLQGKLALVLGGVAVLVGAAFLLLRQGGDTRAAVEDVRGATARTEEATKATTDAAREARAAAERTEAATKAAAEAEAAAAKELATKVDAGAAAAKELAGKVDATAAAAEASGKRVEAAADATTKAADAAKAAAEGAKAAAEASAATTEKVVHTLESLKVGFDALAKQGGVIADADRPEAHYHNARVYEQRGDTPAAMAAYRRYFAAADGLGLLDPHLRYQALLRVQQGPGGAREAYEAMRATSKDDVTAFAATLLLDGEARVAALTAWATAHPTFAPAAYELSREFSAARLGTPALEDRRLEREHLRRFLELRTTGSYLAHFLDQGVAAAQVDDAERRLAAAASLDDAVLAKPVSVVAMQSNQQWTLTFTFAEPVKEIRWRAGGKGEFASTGFLEGYQAPGGGPLPRYAVELPLDAPRTELEVRYVDARGRDRGPFPLVFDPAAQVVVGAKRALDMTKSSWLSFRDYDGKVLLYFTGLLSYRAAFEEIRYGVDVETPDRKLPFSPADPKNPYAVNTDDLLYLEVPAGTKFATVQLRYKDGTTTEIVKIKR